MTAPALNLVFPARSRLLVSAVAIGLPMQYRTTLNVVVMPTSFGIDHPWSGSPTADRIVGPDVPCKSRVLGTPVT